MAPIAAPPTAAKGACRGASYPIRQRRRQRGCAEAAVPYLGIEVDRCGALDAPRGAHKPLTASAVAETIEPATGLLRPSSAGRERTRSMETRHVQHKISHVLLCGRHLYGHRACVSADYSGVTTTAVATGTGRAAAAGVTAGGASDHNHYPRRNSTCHSPRWRPNRRHNRRRHNRCHSKSRGGSRGVARGQPSALGAGQRLRRRS